MKFSTMQLVATLFMLIISLLLTQASESTESSGVTIETESEQGEETLDREEDPIELAKKYKRNLDNLLKSYVDKLKTVKHGKYF